MKVQDLVGAKVWIEQFGLPECVGYIVHVPKPVNLEDIELSVDASVFTILLESGDIVETSGFNLLEIEHAGYLKEMDGDLPTDRAFLVRFKSSDIATEAVIAARVEIRGEHLAFVNSRGQLAALFLFESVECYIRVMF